jgi:DNA-binding MarR family transcriptional regulator
MPTMEADDRGDDPPREALIASIVGELQGLSLASDRIGAAFAARQDLHQTDFRALTAITRAEREGDPLTGRRLADELRLSQAAVSYLVDRLAASGHVWREPDPRDGRRTLLHIGGRGRQVAAAFFGPLSVTHEAALAPYSAAELELCLRFLADVNGALSSFGDELPH